MRHAHSSQHPRQVKLEEHPRRYLLSKNNARSRHASIDCAPSETCRGRLRLLSSQACEKCLESVVTADADNAQLKCTADERPCMNCRLYGAECANTKQPRLPRSSTSKLKNRKKTLDNTRSSSRGITTPASTLVPDLTSIAQERETSNMTFDLGTPRTIIRLDPQISLSHDRYENAQQQFESTEFSMNGMGSDAGSVDAHIDVVQNSVRLYCPTMILPATRIR